MRILFKFLTSKSTVKKILRVNSMPFIRWKFISKDKKYKVKRSKPNLGLLKKSAAYSQITKLIAQPHYNKNSDSNQHSSNKHEELEKKYHEKAIKYYGWKTWAIIASGLIGTWGIGLTAKKFYTDYKNRKIAASTEIGIAAMRNDLDKIEHLLERGANVNEQDEYGNTPLHYAVRNAHLKIVNYLLHSGANPLIVNKKNQNAFYLACIAGNLLLMELILANGDRINRIKMKEHEKFYKYIEQIFRSFTQFQIFTDVHIENDYEHFESLLKKYLQTPIQYNIENINIKTTSDWTPLIAAVFYKHDIEFIKFLVRNKAKVNVIGDYTNKIALQDAPMYWAIRSKNDALVSFLLNNEDDALDFKLLYPDSIKGNLSCLHVAIEFSTIEILKLIVEKIKNASLKNELEEILNYPAGILGYSPLHAAIHKNDIEMVKVLLELNQVKIDSLSNFNRIPLQHAKNSKMKAYLIVKMAERYKLNCAHKSDDVLNNIIHCENVLYDFDLQKSILEKVMDESIDKIKINERFIFRLRFYISMGYLSEAEKLFSQENSQIDKENLEQILFDAVSSGDINTYNFVKRHLLIKQESKAESTEKIILPIAKTNKWTTIMVAVWRQRTEMVEHLLELLHQLKTDAKTNYLNARNDKGQTAIYLAVQNGDIALVKKLLAAGADPKIADDSGFTPVHIAAYHGNVEMLNTLMQSSSLNVDVKTSSGHYAATPLHLAVLYADNVDIVRVLLDTYKANPLEVTSQGKNAASLARIPEIRKELRERLKQISLETEESVVATTSLRI